MPHLRLVALACLIALAPFAGADAPRTQTQPYFGNNDALRVSQFDNVCVGGPHTVHQVDHLGGVCFTPRSTETHVQIAITDKTGLPVGGFYAFHTLSGAYVTGRFCGATGANIPADTWTLSVVVDGAIQGPVDCNPSGHGAGVGTAGDITAVFT